MNQVITITHEELLMGYVFLHHPHVKQYEFTVIAQHDGGLYTVVNPMIEYCLRLNRRSA